MTHLFSHTASESSRRATVRFDPSRTVDRKVPATLFGKFGEHLYSPHNASNVLEAQVLFNPTFGSWKFQDRTFGADGGRGQIHDPDEIAERIETYVDTHDLPSAERLRDAYHDGTALWWFPYGGAVETSPDVGTAGDRAQRIEPTGSEIERAGIAQWTRLPLHRTRTFDGRVTLRASAETPVRIALHETVDTDGSLGPAVAATTVTAPSTDETRSFSIEAPATLSADPDEIAGISVTVADATANVVVDRLLLYPDDHVDTVDPEIVALFDELDLPVLRWPGGNFASGYHWRDGAGPIESRPTKPNPAWDALETNLFGTDEFLRFCAAVGCEPMICVNAGDGSPAEAARWVEYCNGDTDTEMGALRAEHGHPEPYDVSYWEIGNELYGEWQLTWTTPGGNADRFGRFREAMTAVDDSIEVMACGNRCNGWNEALPGVLGDGDWLTDHILLECHADAATDPVELFNAHTGFAQQLSTEYQDVAETFEAAGVETPPLAITELQLFTRFDEADGDATGAGDARDATDAPSELSQETLPTSHSITEAVFDATVVTQSIRDGLVEMITHSGVGNHGGGIQQRHERTWADPCFYGQQLGLALSGGQPIGVDVTCSTFSTDVSFGEGTSPWFGELRAVSDRPAIDVVAVSDADDHAFAALLVHRDAGTGSIEIAVGGGGVLTAFDTVEQTTLTAETMHAENTLSAQDRITPTRERLAVDGDEVTITLPQYSIVTLTAD